MPTRIADLRPKVSNITEAEAIMSLIAERRVSIAVANARAEKRIVAIKTDLGAQVQPLQEEIAALEKSLSDFIESNPQHFVKPRHHRCDFGTFGLRTVTEVEVTGHDECLAHVVRRKFEDCFKVATSLIKTGLEARLKEGEKIPGCRIKTGDVATYKITPAIIDQAVETAVES